MYEENYGTLLRDTKVDFNKWKDYLVCVLKIQ